MPTRIEHDSIGTMEVSAEAYYGVHALRAVLNFRFPSSNLSFSLSALVKAFVTRIPLMLFSRLALISAIALRVSRNALRIFRRRE